jgi:hypothetical protein
LEIGPLPSAKKPKLKFCDFLFNEIPYELIESKLVRNEKNQYYYVVYFEDNLNIQTDININFEGNVNFSLWVNLWCTSLNLIQKFLDDFHIQVKNSNDNTVLSIDKSKLLGEQSSRRDFIFKESLLKSAHIFTVGKKESDKSGSELKTKELTRLEESPDDIIYSEPNASDDLFDIMKKIYHNNDLHVLLKAINKFVTEKGKMTFNKNEMSMVYKGTELDKFNKSKGAELFELKIVYSLMD